MTISIQPEVGIGMRITKITRTDKAIEVELAPGVTSDVTWAFLEIEATWTVDGTTAELFMKFRVPPYPEDVKLILYGGGPNPYACFPCLRREDGLEYDYHPKKLEIFCEGKRLH
jgi:hypothetical protein